MKYYLPIAMFAAVLFVGAGCQSTNEEGLTNQQVENIEAAIEAEEATTSVESIDSLFAEVDALLETNRTLISEEDLALLERDIQDSKKSWNAFKETGESDLDFTLADYKWIADQQLLRINREANN